MLYVGVVGVGSAREGTTPIVVAYQRELHPNHIINHKISLTTIKSQNQKS